MTCSVHLPKRLLPFCCVEGMMSRHASSSHLPFLSHVLDLAQANTGTAGLCIAPSEKSRRQVSREMDDSGPPERPPDGNGAGRDPPGSVCFGCEESEIL